jgi:hypothetical protein
MKTPTVISLERSPAKPFSVCQIEHFVFFEPVPSGSISIFSVDPLFSSSNRRNRLRVVNILLPC